MYFYWHLSHSQKMIYASAKKNEKERKNIHLGSKIADLLS